MIPADLFGALADAPDLPGAACRGLAPTFDEPAYGESSADVEYRHRVAQGICSTCPALAACSTWLASLPAKRRPSGVVAGTVVDSHTKRKAIA